MLVSSLITVLGLAFVVGILYHYFQGQLMGELKKEAVYISRGCLLYTSPSPRDTR